MSSTTTNDSQTVRPLLLRRKDVEAMVGLSRSSLYDKMSRGEFPMPACVGGSRRWLMTDLEEWAAKLPKRETRRRKPARG